MENAPQNYFFKVYGKSLESDHRGVLSCLYFNKIPRTFPLETSENFIKASFIKASFQITK